MMMMMMIDFFSFTNLIAYSLLLKENLFPLPENGAQRPYTEVSVVAAAVVHLKSDFLTTYRTWLAGWKDRRVV